MRILSETLAKFLYRGARDFVFAHIPANSVGAEIGVFRGDFSERILKKSNPKCLHLIDPWRSETEVRYQDSLYGQGAGADQEHMNRIHHSVQNRFQSEIESGRIHIHRCSSDAAAEEIEDAGLDWAYIDGNHLYEFVRKDLQTYYRKIRAGGILAGDDYGIRGWWDDGVTKAVDEFIQETACEVLAIKKAQFVLRKPLN